MEQPSYPDAGRDAGSTYAPDKAWGIVIIVLSALGGCFNILLAGAGAFLGSNIASMSNDVKGVEGAPDPTALGLVGGIIAIMGVVLAISSAIQLVGGIGILKSRRWGFILTGTLAVLSILLSLTHLNVLSLVYGVSIYYCAMRLTGKMGPTPV